MELDIKHLDMTLQDKIEGIGQSLRWASNGKANPIIYAVIFWGNQHGEGGITKIIECKSNRDRGGWFNDNYGISIAGGKVSVSKVQQAGSSQNIYISPNENDCQIYTAAYISAMAMTNPVAEINENVLYGVGVFYNPETLKAAEGVYLYFSKNKDGKFICDKYPQIIVDKPGEDVLVNKVDNSYVMKIFTSYDKNDLSLIAQGINMSQMPPVNKD